MPVHIEIGRFGVMADLEGDLCILVHGDRGIHGRSFDGIGRNGGRDGDGDLAVGIGGVVIAGSHGGIVHIDLGDKFGRGEVLDIFLGGKGAGDILAGLDGADALQGRPVDDLGR